SCRCAASAIRRCETYEKAITAAAARTPGASTLLFAGFVFATLIVVVLIWRGAAAPRADRRAAHAGL
ncbi:MAG: hypothetical protein V8T01_01110, partial [Oscillospiraceae bacterium]